MHWNYDDIGAITIGNGVSVGPQSVIEVVSTSAMSPVPGSLHISDGAAIGWFANIRAAGGRISIGRNALLAQNITLVASNHTLSRSAPYKDLPWDAARTGVDIGDNAWIGAGAIILPGCSVGQGAVIGAGSVVTRSVPPWEIWAGSPARRIRTVP